MTPEIEPLPSPPAPGVSIMPPSTAAATKPGFGVGGAIGLCLLWLFVVALAGLEVSFLQRLLGEDLAAPVQLLLIHLLGTAAVLWVGLPRSGLSLADALPLRRVPVALIPGVVLAGFGLFLVTPMLFTWLPGPPRWLVKFFQALTGNGWGPFLLVGAVAVPVLEELLFRGLLLGTLRRRYSTATAVIVSTALFALVHGNFTQGSAALVLGLLASWLVVRTGSLLPGMLLHATWNASPAVLAFALSVPASGQESAGGATPHTPVPLLLAGAAAAAVGLLALGWRLHGTVVALPAPRPTRKAPLRLAAVLFLPLTAVIVTGILSPARGVGTLAGPAAPAIDPATVAGCYELTSPAAPLTLFADSGPSRLRLRLTLEKAPLVGYGSARYHLQPVPDTAGRPSAPRAFWSPAADGVRLVRLGAGGGTVVRARPQGEDLIGTVSRYAADGGAVGRAASVRGQRIACPAADSPGARAP